MSSIPLPERHDHPRFAWLRVGRPEKHAPGTTSTVLLSMNLAGIGKGGTRLRTTPGLAGHVGRRCGTAPLAAGHGGTFEPCRGAHIKDKQRKLRHV